VVSVAERPSHSANVPNSTARLACKAFHVVFQQRQTQHTALLAWLRVQMAAVRPSSTGERQLLESAAAWRTAGAGGPPPTAMQL
jgi:hypothetical protein